MSNPNELIIDAAGLNTQPNELTLAPGSLSVATNMEITRDGIIEIARGFQSFSNNLPAFQPQQLLVVGGVPYLNLDGGLWYYDTTSGNWLRKTGNFGAKLGTPKGIWTDGTTLYSADSTNHVIFSINLVTGARSVLAGRFGASGGSDGTGDAARFNTPLGIWGDGSGNLYVADSANGKIRKVTSSGVVTTFASSGLTIPNAVWGDVAGNLYVTDAAAHAVFKVAISGTVSTLASGGSLSSPNGIWGDGSGNLYVSDSGSFTILQVTATGTVSIIYNPGAFTPFGITGDGSGFLYVRGQLGAVGGAVIRMTTSGASASIIGSGVGGDHCWYSLARIFCSSANAGSGTLVVFYSSTGYSQVIAGLTGVAAASGQSLWADGIAVGPDASSTARRIRSAALNGNTYFTSNSGVLKSTASSASFTPAGLPQCLDLNLSLSSAGSPVLLANGASRGYRGVWCMRDANNNLIKGAPSSRFTINNNAGATRDVSVVVTLPPEIATSHFFQLYATAQQSTAAVDVGDEQRLIYEYFPASGDITTGTFTIVDIAPDAFRQDDLYTNQSQEGIAAANFRPPLARDICAFRRRMLYANFTEQQLAELQLLGTTGMSNGQTITIAGVVYTAGTGAGAESTTTGTFQVWQTGGQDKGTQSLNVEYTAKSLVNVINKYAGNSLVYAYYNSGVDDAPGDIIIKERGIGGASFAVTCSASAIGNLFSPALPTAGTTYSSTANIRVNRIRVSKTDQPEHCPLDNDIVVGGEDEAIERIIPLRTSVIIIKSHSIWRLVNGDAGEEPVFVDNTVSISGRDSAAALNNTVFFLSDQGFVAVNDNGVQLVGRPIESRVLAGLEATNAPNHSLIVGMGHEQRRIYVCATYDAGAAETTCYMFSPIANKGKGAWTKRRLNACAFAVYNNRLMYALSSSTGNVLRQRASLRDGLPWYRDFCEDQGTFTITAVDSVNNLVTGTLSGNVNFGTYYNDVGMGWKFYQGSNQYLVLGANKTGSTYTLVCNTVSSLVAGAVTIYRPIEWTLEYTPLIAGNPLETDQFLDVLVKAETSNVYAVDVQYANNTDTRATPYSDDWVDPSPPDRVFIPIASGARASATSNDFGATVGMPVPYNHFRTQVHPQYAYAEQLSVRLSGGTAEGYIGVKGLAVQTSSTHSNKGRV